MGGGGGGRGGAGGSRGAGRGGGSGRATASTRALAARVNAGRIAQRTIVPAPTTPHVTVSPSSTAAAPVIAPHLLYSYRAANARGVGSACMPAPASRCALPAGYTVGHARDARRPDE